MAFFDNSVCCETNDKMVREMDQVDGERDPLKRVTLNDISVAQLGNKSVADFVTKNIIISSFTKLRLPQEFLQFPAPQWAKNHIIRLPQLVARTAAFISDHAERGAALIHQFSGSLAKNEDQLQFLLQIVVCRETQTPSSRPQANIVSHDESNINS